MRRDPRRLPPLDLLVAFDASARHLSFTRAATERSLTQSAVSRQIAALEDDLGSPLFRRRHRALELTDEGTRLAAATATALAALREAVQAIRTPRQRDVVSLTTTPGFASLWLIPRLARFVAEHPAIDVRIDASYDKRALAAEGFDIALRYGRIDRLRHEGGEALFAETVQPLVAPALLRGARPLKRPQDLATHTLLHLALVGDDSAAMPLEWRAWLKTVGVSGIEPAATLTFTSYDTAVAAALEGQGILLGRSPLTDGLVAQGRLVAPFKGRLASAHGYCIVAEPVALQRPSVAAFVQWLRGVAQGAAVAPLPAGDTAGATAAAGTAGTPGTMITTGWAPQRSPRARSTPGARAKPRRRSG